jgi:hypothetical protein
MHRDAVTIRGMVTVLSACALSTGCGASIRTKVVEAMEGCLAVRNPAFVRGDGDRALTSPLPAAVLTIADRTAYAAGLRTYQQAASDAETQAELTCAMELGARYRSDDTREWLATFTGHPNAPVAHLAARLLAAQ